jgi:hypothetical protein
MKTKRLSKMFVLLSAALMLTVLISATRAGDFYWDDGGSYLINDETYKTDWVHVDYNIANVPGTHVDLVDGGEVNMLLAYNNATVTMSGGWADFISCYNDSTINVTGGIASMRANDTSTINIYGGDANAEIWGHGTINYLNNDFYCPISARDYGIAFINGGLVTGINATSNSTIYLHKCQIEGGISGSSDSIINIYALDMQKFTSGGFFDNGYMSGHWLDGTEFQVDFGHPDTYSHVFMIPEPSVLSLFAVGFLYLSRKKR